MSLDFGVTAFVTLFVIIDPIGLAPLFLALTHGATTRQRRAIGVRALAIGFFLLALFGLGGERLLDAVGIDMAAFRIAGGLLLFLTAVDMLFERRQPRRENTAHQADALPDPTVFPLATPLIAGPGALATMVLLIGQHPGDYAAQAVVYAAMTAVLGICYVLFLAGGLIERVLGPTGINVVTRLFGMLLAALSVQFVVEGLRAFGFGSGG
ncbi:MarC family protein [Amaricoccus sp.]|uniref:MarC family protein n=1 Tax=Amaricoccus sp. TaxID=1872485 RepID=UPI001B4F418A|nr:MarC family protein [Amaricoccus sp.]MBP7241965.1 MarC family protein [Amaricoccus sp.]